MAAFKAGHARECITPPLGIHMVGYAARTEGAADVHDELYLDAVALEGKDQQVVLMAYDLCLLRLEEAAEIKSAIERELGLGAERVLLNTSHTHAGPALGRREGPSELEDKYRADVVAKSVEAARGALEDLSEASFAAGAAPLDIGCNRRERREDGTIWLGHNPQGPSMREVTVWRLARPDGPDIVLFSSPMHGTTLGGQNLSISAEWMGVARRDTEAGGRSLKAVFLQGCGADQDPYYTKLEKGRGTFEEVEEHGRKAAEAVRQALSEMQPLEPLPLRVAMHSVELPPKEAEGEPQPLPLHGIRLGEAILVALGAETFVRYALFGRDASPAKETLVLGYSNGNIGYLPTADAYEEGGYEINTTRVGPGAEQLVKDVMLQLFDELKQAD